MRHAGIHRQKRRRSKNGDKDWANDWTHHPNFTSYFLADNFYSGNSKTADERPIRIPDVPLVRLSTRYAETQTPPDLSSIGSIGGSLRKDNKSRSQERKREKRRKGRSKDRERDRYEEIMDFEPKLLLCIPCGRINSSSQQPGITPTDRMPKGKIHNKNYDSDDDDMSCGHWCEYVIVVVLSSILLVASLVLVLFWCLYYRKGYAWNDNPKIQFNLHPTLMIAGFIFFSGFSMLLYRISRCCRRIYVKLLHTLFHTLAIPCVVLGFMAVLDYHNLADPPIPNFYSIHSWMGFVTMGLFALQFVVGFFSFLLLLCCDSATAGFRASLVPVHATFGLTTFMLAVATCLTGLTEAAYFNFGAPGSTAVKAEQGIDTRAAYASWKEEGIVMNALAMVLVALGILVSYAVRREPLRVHSVSYVSERL
ncbi:Eukaryotic cytochrome b561 [Nesidiocoris tenuis]|uniref:Eukaryotic cytochrome b561 n=1 Tax=Nesidiocoris tenuis TaxID=355587 RepID=A0ABN7AXU0_9HEMI|nr:Eukaryotic cytochrome b561 [Nesidiocoris tenuis]